MRVALRGDRLSTSHVETSLHPPEVHGAQLRLTALGGAKLSRT